MYAFGEYALDAGLFELRRSGARVPVQPKPLALLLYLVARRDRLVPRAELVEHLWPDVVVSEDALFQAVKGAREAVGDRHRTVIETVRGVGFRFVARVDETSAAGRASAARASCGTPGDRPLVGREPLLARVEAALDLVTAGRGRLLDVEGEAGAGKTRLLDAIADRAEARGARVARAVCREAGGPALGPWSHVLESLLADAGEAELARLTDPEARAWLVRIAPALRERLGPVAEPAPDSAAVGALPWRPFAAVSAALDACAVARPVVVLIDDLHWADAASIRLAEFLLDDLARRRILLVVARRDERHGAARAIDALAGAAARLDVGETLRVEGLSCEDVGRVLAWQLDGPADPALVSAVHARTAGNPFFVGQVARELSLHLAEDGTGWEQVLARVPAGVRQVVSGRLARLEERTRDLLALAAIAGLEFDVALVERASEGARGGALDALEDALAARLVHEIEGAPGRLRFGHALIREAITADLPGLRRARLHRAVAEALEAQSARDPEPPAAQLAYHFHEAAPTGTGPAAARWAMRAGEIALRRGAYEEAAGMLERAAAGLGPGDLEPDARFQLLFSLGRAQHLGLGDYVRARESFQGAAAIARARGDAARLAETALAYAAIPQSSVVEVEEPCREILEDALAAQPPDAAVLRCRLLGRLAAFLANDPRRQAEAVAFARSALDAARGAGARGATLEALLALNRALRLQGETGPEERLVVSTESCALAVGAQDPMLETIARGQRVTPLLELARGAEAEEEAARYAALAEGLRAPALRWIVPIFAAMQHLLRGELDRVEAAAAAALPIASRVPGSVAPGVFAILLFALRREQGRLAEMEPAMRGLVDRYAAVPGPRAWLAFLLVEGGRRDEARRELDRLAADDFASLAGTEGWRPCLGMLAETAVALGDRDRAAGLARALAPVAQHCLVLGDGILCLGPTGRVLGAIAALLGEGALAEAHFERALRQCDGLRSPPWAARTRLDFGRALLRIGRPRDRSRAHALLGEAEASATALGMVRAAQEAREARSG